MPPDLARSIRGWSRPSAWRNLLAIAGCWLVALTAIAGLVLVARWRTGEADLFAAIAAADLPDLLWLGSTWLALALVIAGRQHALGVLMHEAVHGHLLAHRRWGDLISDLCCAWPMHITTAGYRHRHLAHHRHTNGDGDPDWTDMQTPAWRWPRTRAAAAGLLLADACALTLPHWLRVAHGWSAWSAWQRPGATHRRACTELAGYLAFCAGEAVALTLLGWWDLYLLCWLVPSLTVLNACIRLRAVSEHLGLDATGEPTRHVDGAWWERALIAPCGINIHIAHHRHPSVLWYHLPALHHALRDSGAYPPGTQLVPRYLGRGDSVWRRWTTRVVPT